VNLIGSYNYALVALSVSIAIVASYTALDLAGRVTAARGRIRAVWLLGGAIAMGTGIWSMHYIGMLAFILPVPVAYHWPTVLLSLFAAILASAIALYVVSRQRMDAFRAFAGSVLMGAGIASMHYIGMAAMRLPAMCHFDSLIVVMSVVFAVLISLAAIWITFHFRDEKTAVGWGKIAGTVVMGAAIPVMHYTGMAAAGFTLSGMPMDLSHAVSISTLGTAVIAAVTLIVLGLALLTSWMDRRFAVRSLVLQEVKLKQSEAYLAEAQRLSHTGSFGWRVATGEILWSEETFRIFQYDPTTKPTIGLILQRVHPEDAAFAKETIERASQDGQDFDVEHRLLMPDGAVKYIHVLAHAERDQSGNIEYVGAAMDISARRRAEDELRKSEEKYRDLVDLSPDAIYLRDRDGNLVSSNPAGLELLRCTAQEAAGMSTAESYLPEELALYRERLEKLNAGAQLRFERTFVRKDGTQVPVEVSSSSMRHGYSQVVIRDISERKRAETNLRRSEAYLAEAQKLSRTGSWACTPDLETTYLSEEMFRIMGIPAGEISGASEEISKQFTPETWVGILELFESARWKKIKFHGEFPMRLADGSNRMIRIVGHPVLDAAGDIVEFVGTTVDVTEQRQARAELEKAFARIKKSEDQLRVIIDTIPTLAWSTLPDGSAGFLSRSWLDYTGLSAEEARNGGWSVALHAEDSTRFMNKWRAALATGEPFEAEARFRRADGKYRWCLVRGVPLRDELGRIAQWYGTNTDIEDLKLAEALLAGEKRLLEMIAKGNSLDLILDALCRLVEELSSDSLSSILMLDPHDNSLWHGAAPSLPGTYTEAINGAVIGPSEGSCGTAAYRKEPVIVSDIATDPLWVDYRDLALAHGLRACWSTPILSSDGRVFGTFAIYSREKLSPTPQQHNIIEQITHLASIAIERKQAEEALRKAQVELAHVTRVMTMGELVASIAHEVNQPLGAIVTNGHTCVRLLSRDVPDIDKSLEVIGRMITDGMRASEVIKRIRDLLHKTPVEKVPLNINETIQEVIALVGNDVVRSKVELKAELEADLPPVLGDRIQLQQVILNLILNAKDAMSGVQTNPRELQMTSGKTNGGAIVVAVRDTGRGLNAKDVERIFDPFFTTKPEGTGLGLSISRTIIEAHGGTLWATQNEDKGATIQFTLPSGSGSES
jgi:PAS domain S-box-containing protein